MSYISYIRFISFKQKTALVIGQRFDWLWHLLMFFFANTKRTQVAKCYHMRKILIRGCFLL